MIIKPRLDLAASLGVSTQSLSQTIRIATIGEIDQNAAKFSLCGSPDTDPGAHARGIAARHLPTIENLPVPTASGGSVPLSRVAEVTFGSGPTSIQRYNQERRIFVGADLAPGWSRATDQDKIDKLPVMQNLPPGFAIRNSVRCLADRDAVAT